MDSNPSEISALETSWYNGKGASARFFFLVLRLLLLDSLGFLLALDSF